MQAARLPRLVQTYRSPLSIALRESRYGALSRNDAGLERAQSGLRTFRALNERLLLAALAIARLGRPRDAATADKRGTLTEGVLL
jgi:hypothetical protein